MTFARIPVHSGPGGTPFMAFAAVCSIVSELRPAATILKTRGPWLTLIGLLACPAASEVPSLPLSPPNT
jgi:hypothetical protein